MEVNRLYMNRLHSVLRTRFQADETVKSPVMDNTNPDPKSREDLETLIDQSRHYAKHMLQKTGCVPPTLMALTPEGLMMFVPSELEDTDAKDKFANTGRLLAVGYKASAVVMILESWATFPKRPGLPLPEGPPSQSPDRKEVVVLMGETRDTRAQQFLFIQELHRVRHEPSAAVRSVGGQVRPDDAAQGAKRQRCPHGPDTSHRDGGEHDQSWGEPDVELRSAWAGKS